MVDRVPAGQYRINKFFLSFASQANLGFLLGHSRPQSVTIRVKGLLALSIHRKLLFSS